MLWGFGGAECFTHGKEPKKVPVIAAVSGSQESVLEVAVGYVDRIYVVVSIEGELHIAQGGVFSYYEFIQPRSNRLTDDQWREMLVADPPALPVWAEKFVLMGGQATDWTFFRVGDVYVVTEEGADLNQRETPSFSGEVLQQFPAYEYIEIIDGPVYAEGETWWKVVSAWGDEEGWVVENQDWLERAWGGN